MSSSVVSIDKSKFQDLVRFCYSCCSCSDIAGAKHDEIHGNNLEVAIKLLGLILNTILNILGGIRSSCTYVGAPSLKQLSKCTTFVRVAKQFNDTFVK